MLNKFLITLILLSWLLPFQEAQKAELMPTLDQSDQVTIQEVKHLPILEDKSKPPQKISESLGIEITAKSAMVVDVDSGQVLFQKNPSQKLSIASLTKLMTAIIFLENNPGFDKEGQITVQDNQLAGAKLYVPNGEGVRVEDLFQASLVGSANNATEALARSTGLTLEDFVRKMNEKAQSWGLKDTQFVDTTGLGVNNISTVSDYARITREAFQIDEIQKATSQREYFLRTLTHNEPHNIVSQNELYDSYLDIVASKTGYLDEAGYCLATQAQNKSEKNIIVILLGNHSYFSRFQETKALVQWTFDNFKWID